MSSEIERGPSSYERLSTNRCKAQMRTLADGNKALHREELRLEKELERIDGCLKDAIKK